LPLTKDDRSALLIQSNTDISTIASSQAFVLAEEHLRKQRFCIHQANHQT